MKRLPITVLAAVAATALAEFVSPAGSRALLFSTFLLVAALLVMWPRPVASVRNAEERARWRETRERGRRHFLIHHGLLRFAVPVGLAMLLYFVVLEPVMFGGGVPRSGDLAESLLSFAVVGIVLWPLAGLLWGMSVWRANERRYASEAA